MDKRILILAAFLLVVGAGVMVFLTLITSSSLHGRIVEPPQPALDFTLITDQGEINLADYRGKLVLLYFGYTFCPDACPTTLSKVSRALKRLLTRTSLASSTDLYFS